MQKKKLATAIFTAFLSISNISASSSPAESPVPPWVEHALKITVAKGELRCDKRWVPIELLREYITKTAAENGVTTVIISAAEGETYGRVLEVLDECRKCKTIDFIVLNVRTIEKGTDDKGLPQKQKEDEKPNQPVQTTTTAVTPAAAQPARQP